MTRKDYLLEKFSEFQKNNKAGRIALYTSPSKVRIEPFKIADNEALEKEIKENI